MKSSSGFLGKGFKFDETEAQLANERKKLQKAALGLQDSDDEDTGVDVSTVRSFLQITFMLMCQDVNFQLFCKLIRIMDHST